MNDKITLDTNVLIYAFGMQDNIKKGVAKELIKHCSVLSLQALNETSFVLLRKFNLPIDEVKKIIAFISQKIPTSPITVNTLQNTFRLMSEYNLSFWDSMMVSAALDNNCTLLYSEDLHHNLLIDNRLTICNPFVN